MMPIRANCMSPFSNTGCWMVFIILILKKTFMETVKPLIRRFCLYIEKYWTPGLMDRPNDPRHRTRGNVTISAGEHLTQNPNGDRFVDKIG